MNSVHIIRNQVEKSLYYCQKHYSSYHNIFLNSHFSALRINIFKNKNALALTSSSSHAFAVCHLFYQLFTIFLHFGTRLNSIENG